MKKYPTKSSNIDDKKSISIPDALKPGVFRDVINVNGVEVSWDTMGGTCNFRGIPVAMMWIDSTLAGLMSGLQSMVGPERFNLALQAEGRKSVESDWLLISGYEDFTEGFAQLNLNAKVAGWGDWQLVSYHPDKQECVFHAHNNWEGGYQKALGVCWGSGMLAGKLAGICGKLFNTNCWSTQTRFVAKGDPYDEFVVAPSERNLEQEIDDLLGSDNASRADMAVALQKLQDAEKILREGENRYDELVRKIPVGIYTFRFEGDGSMSYGYVSPRFCELLGLESNAVLQDYRLAFVPTHPDDLNSLIQANDKARSQLQPFRWEGRFIVQGETRWLSISSDPTPLPDGGSLWHGVVKDITERKQAESDLRIAATAFESQEAMMVTDTNSVILKINQAFSELTGYSAEEIVGQTPRVLRSGRHDANFYREMWETIESTGGWQGEIWDKRKNGEEYPKWLTISAVKNDKGTVTHYIGTHYDITERKQAERKINELAYFDQLTGLPNRTLLLDRLKQAMAISARRERHGALLFIDLDNFKNLNDTLGHDMGDLLLQQVAQRLVTCVREGDSVARLGGDEFVVMLEDLSDSPREAATQAEAVGEKILAILNEPYKLSNTKHQSTPSIGITLFTGHQESSDVLLKRADLAMYEAKSAGRNTLRFFDPEMQSVITKRAALEADLREAVREGQFLLHYQAQLAGGQLTGVEVLVRWKHPQRGMVSPADFIPLAEETGLILPLGRWVLETACTQLVAWASNPERSHLTVAVNVSALQFSQTDFVDEVMEVVRATGANPQRLKLELTESLLVSNVEDIIEKMFALKGKGVGFSLDDFGTGYSSLSYLKRLPLDQLKIDQSFVRDVLSDPNDAAIARTIIALAQSLGLGVIAEGVETEAQRDFLASAGCHTYQGYFFSRPLPLEGFEEFAGRV